MVLPGAGFDVVPSDCLIADLAAAHPNGRCVRLGLAVRSGVSRGTLRTALGDFGNFPIRRNGAIVPVAPGSLRHEFDFGEGPSTALVSGWGDVATAYRSTGIADIETYTQANRQFRSLDVDRPVAQLAAGTATSSAPAGRRHRTGTRWPERTGTAGQLRDHCGGNRGCRWQPHVVTAART